MTDLRTSVYSSVFLKYLAKQACSGNERLPSLTALSHELGISVASLREQLEIARVLGFVEIRPKTGIKWLPYDFAPSIMLSSAYAIEISSTYFDQYRDLRNHLEAVYFYEAVSLLRKNDIEQMFKIIDSAEAKIGRTPPITPHREHRDWHLLLFSHIENIFLDGILSVYWEIYENQGYAYVSDPVYLRNVWFYHRKITEQLALTNYSDAYQIFLEHKDLIKSSPRPVANHKFE
jgi:DNA-binding FadR family transcriptional regulator